MYVLRFKTLLLAWLTIIAVSASAANEETRHGFKLGAGFSGYPSGWGIGLDITFPRMFSIHPGGLPRHSDFHFFLGLDSVTLPNAVPGLLGTLSANNVIFMGGLKGQMVANGSIVIPYTKVGLDIALMDSALVSSSTSAALRAGFGCDFIFSRGEDTWLGMQDVAFFAEGDLVFFHKRADKLTGSPHVLEGFVPRVGLRSHF
jgi:hypothetical protein